MIKYKLTDQKLQTLNGCQWVIGEWKETNGEGPLAGPGWLHCYDSPLLAVLLNPAHANIDTPIGWECEVEGKSLHDFGRQSGYMRMRLIKETPLPVVTAEQRVCFSILCAMEVCDHQHWRTWAQNWLLGKDRSAEAVRASWSAGYDMMTKERGAARASEEAALAAVAVDEWAKVWMASETVAWKAAKAAFEATRIQYLDLCAIAEKAMKG